MISPRGTQERREGERGQENFLGEMMRQKVEEGEGGEKKAPRDETHTEKKLLEREARKKNFEAKSGTYAVGRFLENFF